MCAAPAVVNAILDAATGWEGPIPGRDRVARVICAGAPPPSKTIERIEAELGWEFCQIYGLTETSPLLTINRRRREQDGKPITEVSKELGRAGAPALGVTLSVSDAGEVLARSNVVLEGYWQQPDATADALAGGWFHTGDGGFLDEEGYLTISDRKKDIIITGGENVSSIEVEDCLYSAPGVAECAVIGVPDERWGETIKAIVVRAPGAECTEADLIAHCKARLAGFKAPTSVDFVEVIPRTATGKVQKFKLREPYWQGRDRQVN
jgi:acyl-CoA synthetase (AMP-forming)/AMP-acid ligase II